MSTEPDPRTQELEARVAELEREVDELRQQALPTFRLKALRTVEAGWGEGWKLRPGPPRRHWMDQDPHSYQCLPLVMANQWGWQMLCPTDVQVTWDGGQRPESLQVLVDPKHHLSVRSHFGSGIVTFSPPWLFRTPRGWDLMVKGPTNRWKANCAPLEGIIETWWLNYTFTMNWKLIEPGTVTFAAGESVAQLVPVPHATFDASTAFEAPIMHVEPEAGTELLRWRTERRRVAATPARTHKMYRKAEGIEEHLLRVPVPPVNWTTEFSPPRGDTT